MPTRGIPLSEAFVGAAEKFCEWVDSQPGETTEEARIALRLLVPLYFEGLCLKQPADLDYDLDGERLDRNTWKANPNAK